MNDLLDVPYSIWVLNEEEICESRFNILDTNAFKEMCFGQRKVQFCPQVAGSSDNSNKNFGPNNTDLIRI
jgi:hypothetical protein